MKPLPLSLIGFLLLAAVSLPAAPAAAAPAHREARHIPHDNCYDVACGPLLGGGTEIILAGNRNNKVIRSVDRGLSWTALSGDGLEYQEPFRVEYWPHPIRARYFIGTDDGLWIYFPDTAQVVKGFNGLTLGGADGFINGLSASRNGRGPVLLCNAAGNVYAWDEAAGGWNQILSGGVPDLRSQVAIAPYYDPAAAAGADRLALAAVAGVLHVSNDGGATWSIHSQFATQAQAATDWFITALAFAEDYHQSGVVLLGRGRANAAFPSGEEGEIWRSQDFGQSWSLVYGASSAVSTLLATGPGPSGVRSFYAGVNHYPDHAHAGAATGVLRSDDQGLSWADHGNYQDFYTEEASVGTVNPILYHLVSLAASWDYANDGMLLYARSEGLFRSLDLGDSWRQLRARPERHFRGMDSTRDANGDILVFGGTYGSGTLKTNLTSGETEVLDLGKLHYQQPVSISPNYRRDSLAMMGGVAGIAAWVDPNKPLGNFYGLKGWIMEPDNKVGYVRSLRLSPHFDASGTLPNFDLTLYCSTTGEGSSDGVFRSENGGLSFDLVDRLSSGNKTGFLSSLAIAPTYDAGLPGGQGRTDVFGVSLDTRLVLLVDTVWYVIYVAPAVIQSIALDPSWSRPANPRLYLGLAGPPYLVELTIPAGAPAIATELPAPGMNGALQELALPPDFATNPVVYASTWGSGVKKLDLAAATPHWETVGVKLPKVFAGPLNLSPDFLTDRLVLLGTSQGLLSCPDVPGGEWRSHEAAYTADNHAPGVTFYAPLDPANSQPARPWPWGQVGRISIGTVFPTLKFIGTTISWTDYNDSYVTFDAYARAAELRTHRGPAMGRMRFTIFDLEAETVLASTTVDLAYPIFEDYRVRLEVPDGTRPVRLQARALLTTGEVAGFDGFTIEP